MLAVYLREISESTDGSTPRAHQLADLARVWSDALAEIAIRKALGGSKQPTPPP